jgi:hypothetical protein
MKLSDLQPFMDDLTAQVTATGTVEASGTTLLNTLGAAFVEHAGDPAIIQALGEAMTNAKGSLSSSADSLMAAITANTAAA